MDLQFLGGADHVGKLSMLLETGKNRLLMEYGIDVQTMEPPIRPELPLDAVLLSHAHIDHSGMVPELYRRGYNGSVLSNKTTFDLCSILLRDSIKVQEKRGHPPCFKTPDIEKMEKNKRVMGFGESLEFSDARVEFNSAGHVPGASTILIDSKRRLLFTGDIKFMETQLVQGAKSDYKDIDVLITESTYSYKNHPDREKLAKKLRDMCKSTYQNNGITVIPAFAVGRTQELLLILHDLGIPIYLDGMGRDTTDVILSNPDSVRDHKKLQKAFIRANKINRGSDRKLAIKEPSIIITTSGMLNGGPVGYYIKKLHDREECNLILTGFMVEGTVGRKLLDTGRYVNEGLDVEPKMKTEFMDFSVLPDTQVIIKDDNIIKTCAIKNVNKNGKIHSLSFQPKSLKCSWVPIKNVIKHNYRGDIYSINMKSGRKVDVTKGHSLFVLKDGKVISLPSDKIKTGDYVLIPKKLPISNVKYIDISKFLKRKSNRTPEKLRITPELCRLFGYYVAEGHAIDRIVLTMGNHEEELIKDVIRCIEKIFPKYPISIYSPNESSKQIKFGSSILTRFFKDSCGGDAYSKRVPEFVFSTSKENIANFISAYLAGDGWWDNHIRVKSVSERLIQDIKYLLLGIDIMAKYDGIQVSKERLNSQGNLIKETKAHVLRIQGKNDYMKLLPFLSTKFKKNIEGYLGNIKSTMIYPPHAIPIKESGLQNLKFRDSILQWYIRNSLKSKRNHIDPEKININDVPENVKKIIKGDVAFDLVTKIEKRKYVGNVYDFSVPGAENFVGGFGGIFLHNSAHTDRDHLIKFFKKTDPEKILLVHGDRTKEFAKELKEMGFNAHAPKNGEKTKI